jgi:hypothetical protein
MSGRANISLGPAKYEVIEEVRGVERGAYPDAVDFIVNWPQCERLVEEIAPVPIPMPAGGSETAHKEEIGDATAGAATGDAASATDTEKTPAPAPSVKTPALMGMPGVELEAPPLGKQLDKSTVGGTEAPQEAKLQLTYAQFGKRIGRSPDAVRALVARRRPTGGAWRSTCPSFSRPRPLRPRMASPLAAG